METTVIQFFIFSSSISFNRKFADIEAANHRLASALYFKEDEKGLSSLPSQKPETLDQSRSPSKGAYVQDPEKCSIQRGAGCISLSGTDVSTGSHENDISEKRNPDLGRLWKRHPNPEPASGTIMSYDKNNKSKEELKEENGKHKLDELTSVSSSVDQHEAEIFHTELYGDKSPLKSNNNLSGESQTDQMDSHVTQFSQNVDISPVFSPGLSILSFDSCDSPIQCLFTDIPTCTQAQKNIPDISENQWADIMDLFSVSSKDFAGCMDVEAYFESICECQSDAGQEVCAGDIGFVDQSESLTERICSDRSEDLHCEADEYRHEYACSCRGDQDLTINPLNGAPRQTDDAAKTHFNSLKPSQGTDITQNQLCTSTSYHYNMLELQTYQHPQEESTCMLVNNQHFTPFEGVAQSFSVPPFTAEDRPIQTPPQEDDWLFTDILKDRESPDC